MVQNVLLDAGSEELGSWRSLRVPAAYLDVKGMLLGRLKEPGLAFPCILYDDFPKYLLSYYVLLNMIFPFPPFFSLFFPFFLGGGEINPPNYKPDLMVLQFPPRNRSALLKKALARISAALTVPNNNKRYREKNSRFTP